MKGVPKQYRSENMGVLEQVVKSDNAALLNQLAFDKDVSDTGEALIVMYVAVVLMNAPDVFRHLLEKH